MERSRLRFLFFTLAISMMAQPGAVAFANFDAPYGVYISLLKASPFRAGASTTQQPLSTRNPFKLLGVIRPQRGQSKQPDETRGFTLPLCFRVVENPEGGQSDNPNPALPVGVMGGRPSPRAEPKPATGVGNAPENLPGLGEGLARWNPRLSRRGGGQYPYDAPLLLAQLALWVASFYLFLRLRELEEKKLLTFYRLFLGLVLFSAFFSFLKVIEVFG